MKYEKIAGSLKVLGGIERIQIILYLSSGEKCVCSIFKHLKLPQNLVSYHLGILRKNGLIIGRKSGKWVHYSLDKKGIEELRAFLREITQKEKRVLTCKNKE